MIVNRFCHLHSAEYRWQVKHALSLYREEHLAVACIALPKGKGSNVISVTDSMQVFDGEYQTKKVLK